MSVLFLFVIFIWSVAFFFWCGEKRGFWCETRKTWCESKGRCKKLSEVSWRERVLFLVFSLAAQKKGDGRCQGTFHLYTQQSLPTMPPSICHRLLGGKENSLFFLSCTPHKKRGRGYQHILTKRETHPKNDKNHQYNSNTNYSYSIHNQYHCRNYPNYKNDRPNHIHNHLAPVKNPQSLQWKMCRQKLLGSTEIYRRNQLLCRMLVHRCSRKSNRSRRKLTSLFCLFVALCWFCGLFWRGAYRSLRRTFLAFLGSNQRNLRRVWRRHLG